MTLATYGHSGPWCAPLVFVHDASFRLYWLSNPAARHSKVLSARRTVASSIVARWQSNEEEALQIAGTAARYRGHSAALERKMRRKRGELAGLDDELVWYVMTPKRIEITHNRRFGYQKMLWTPSEIAR